VRVSLPLMIIISLALHVGVAAGLALVSFRGKATPVAVSATAAQPVVMLLRSVSALVSPQPALVQRPIRSVVRIAPVPLPAIESPVQKIAKFSPPPALALEANPNAHLEALPPEAVLSPSPAPSLNGKDGIVFILDISGSMYEPYAGSTRLAFARETLVRRIRALKDGTPFALILYAQNARPSGPLVAASEATREAAVRFVLRDVDCGGGTNLPSGLSAAQQLHPGSLVLVSDGDLNITSFSLLSQARAILSPQGDCPGMTVIGIAPRPNTDARQLLQGLADQQGAAYQTEPRDAGELLTSAKDEDSAR
jgi:hypothetical protein